MKNIYKRIVLAFTSFFCGASGAFLLSGAGAPGLNVLIGLIFFVSLINLSLHVKDYYQNFKKRLAEFNPPAKPEDGQGGGQGGGGGQSGGGQQGGGPKH